MHLSLLEQFQHRNSFVHHLDPRTKIVTVFLVMLLVAITPAGSYWIFFTIYCFLLAVIGLAKVNLLYILKRSVIALPFALAAITLLFTVPGETLMSIPVLGGIEISTLGVTRFITILVKSWISVQAATLLIATTAFTDLIWGLRALHLPVIFVMIVSFAHRYLFVLSDERLRLIQARTARSAVCEGRRSGGTILWRGKVTGQLIGSLMLRSLERSERIYNAMVSRGYQGDLRILDPPRMKRLDYAVLIVTFIIFLIILFSLRTFGS